MNEDHELATLIGPSGYNFIARVRAGATHHWVPDGPGIDRGVRGLKFRRTGETDEFGLPVFRRYAKRGVA